jgi:NAD-dependent deacetylase
LLSQNIKIEILHKINASRQIAVLTGAGISAESGIPTFRGNGGLWKNFRAEELATPDAYRRDPKLVWEWYEMRRKICKESIPNPGHIAIAKLERINPSKNFHLFTQNVDGLHRKAGTEKITELHGNIFTGRCTRCSHIEEKLDTPLPILPPPCPKCQSPMRPHILWFGETYDSEMLENAITFLRNSDLILIIGTSGQVTVPVYLAQEAIQAGAFSVEINPEESTLSSSVDISLRGKSGEILPQLI